MCGVWSPALGLQPSPEDKLELRTDLTGVVLRGTSETEPPFSQTEPAGQMLPRGQVWREGDHRQVTVHQFYGDVWKGLQEATNFSFSMVGSVDYNWGSRLANGSWDGMVKRYELC